MPISRLYEFVAYERNQDYKINLEIICILMRFKGMRLVKFSRVKFRGLCHELWGSPAFKVQ